MKLWETIMCAWHSLLISEDPHAKRPWPILEVSRSPFETKESFCAFQKEKRSIEFNQLHLWTKINIHRGCWYKQNIHGTYGVWIILRNDILHSELYRPLANYTANGLLPDCTKPLPELIVTSLYWIIVAFTWSNFIRNAQNSYPWYELRLQPPFPKAIEFN